MKVLISGAGVAGLTTAYWLNRFGFTVTIVEKAEALRTGGYKIDIRGVALDVAKFMSIYPALLGLKTDIRGATIVDRTGNLITEMLGDTFNLRSEEDIEVMRGDLCELLFEQIKGLECRFGDAISAISQDDEGVIVEFERSEPARYDLVIGADGVHSNIRKHVFGEESLFAKNLGFSISVFSVPNDLNLDRWEMEYSEPGRLVNLYSIKGNSVAKAAFLFSSTHSNLDTIQKQKTLIREVYSDIGWEVPKLLAAMESASDFYFDSITQICMHHWSKGRVVLVGDAGYCASPMSGQGTSLAMVGAYVLSGELSKAKGDYKKAFTQYHREIRSYVKKNQKFGQITAEMMQDKNGLVGWIHEQLVKIIPGKLVHYLTNRAQRKLNEIANSYHLKLYE